MKISKIAYLLFIGLVLSSACKNSSRENYIIRDFRDALQPCLAEAVSDGIVGYYDVINDSTTDKELIQLSQSEHPVLRALALRVMLHRKSFNHFDIIMDHLSDTAFVNYNDGEFGVHRRRIADDILMETNFRGLANKEKIINKILTKYNNLTSAYYVLESIPPQEKYYPYIKDMAQRKRGYDDGTDFGDGFHTIEYALYGLARYKKQDDIPIIKQKFLDNLWQLSHLSFQIMQEFPNETYLDIFEKLYYDHYLDSRGNNDEAHPINFINAVAVYKNERSAKILGLILDSLMSSKHFNIRRDDTDYETIYAIWNNPCEAYLKLRKKVEPIIKIEEKELMK